MRPTWHFVAPEDIRWMLALTSPRVHAVNEHMYRQLELDTITITQSNTALVKALRGGKQLTRKELRDVLRRAGIAVDDGLRLGYIMMRGELDGIICSGARRGKQFTYALLDERAPHAKLLARDEALAELTTRYFTSHGPATVHDFAWWSGLTTADVRHGIEIVKSKLLHEVIDDQTFWFAPPATSARGKSRSAYLLPNYDEYTIAYRDHRAIFDKVNLKNLIYGHVLILHGRIVGTWKRTLKHDGVIVQFNSFAPLTKTEHRAVVAAAKRFGAFLGLRVVLIE
jgi:hypothetical protein